MNKVGLLLKAKPSLEVGIGVGRGVEISADTYASLQFPPNKKVLRVSEIAEKLDVSEQHVLDLIDAGKLRAFDVSSGGKGSRHAYRIPVEAYQEYLRSCFY